MIVSILLISAWTFWTELHLSQYINLIFLKLGLVQEETFAITEVSCSGVHKDYVWIKTDLTKGEQTRLQNLIADCKSNPNGGFYGTLLVDVKTPKGNVYRMGGYSLLQKNGISCGIQESASFIGGTIPNEAIGYTDSKQYEYELQIHGVYYLAKDNYTIPYPYNWLEPAYARCVNTLVGKCPDGTPVDDGTHTTAFCSTVQKGKYCTDNGYLVDRAPFCACAAGFEASGGECVLKEEKNPPPPPPVPVPQTPNPSPGTSNPPPTGGTGGNTSPPPTNPPPTTQPSPGKNNTYLIAGIAILAVIGGGLYSLGKKRSKK